MSSKDQTEVKITEVKITDYTFLLDRYLPKYMEMRMWIGSRWRIEQGIPHLQYASVHQRINALCV
jgi:hypothetical protein